MPYNRPGPGVYVTNGTEPLQHGMPCVVDNFVGVAVKQRTRGWGDAFSLAAIIDPGEPFFIITKGVVQVPDADISTAVKGDEIWVSEDGTLGTAGDAKFGRIVEVAGERGTPLNRVRIDLDSKDSF